MEIGTELKVSGPFRKSPGKSAENRACEPSPGTEVSDLLLLGMPYLEKENLKKRQQPSDVACQGVFLITSRKHLPTLFATFSQFSRARVD